MHGRTFEFSNKAKLHISFEGDLFTLNNQEFLLLRILLNILDKLGVVTKKEEGQEK